MRVGIAVLALAGAAVVANARAAEQVDIPLGEDKLRGVLFRPVGQGPFAAAVAMHGCGGLAGGDAEISPLYEDWGSRLAGMNIAVLLPDSFGSRGIGSQCRVRERKVRASRERVADANAARRWLQQQSWVMAERVALMGWSAGAIATLWAVRPRAAARDGRPDFRSAVAFYPGCRRLGETGWSARIPTLILIGNADDWTPARDCQQMVAGARGRSARAEIVTFPGAYHGFDRPDSTVRELSGLAYTPDGSGRAHVGTDPAARADALKRVPEWLARTFGLDARPAAARE
jgi:dienelactone hydrolase